MECFGKGTATFLLLGASCTRRCRFCAVDKSPVLPPDPDEPVHTADAIKKMGLRFCVLTMVTRDDLPDGGAELIARTIEAVRETCPGVGVEVLISDLAGYWPGLERILGTAPEVLNHNVETVPRLYPTVRPQADYRRSVELIAGRRPTGRLWPPNRASWSGWARRVRKCWRSWPISGRPAATC
jgi:lipoic acid synthetase